MAQVSGYRFFALSLLLLLAFQVWGRKAGQHHTGELLETRGVPPMVSGSISSIGMRSPAWAMTSSTRATPGRAPLLAEQGQVDGGSTAPPATSSRPAPSSACPSPISPSPIRPVHQPGIQLQGWHSLQGTGYRVEFRRGAKLPEMMLGKVVAPGPALLPSPPPSRGWASCSRGAVTSMWSRP